MGMVLMVWVLYCFFEGGGRVNGDENFVVESKVYVEVE